MTVAMKVFLMICFGLLQACTQVSKTELSRAENVDLNRFMGDWYVIANIPTFIETDAHNAIESYAMNKDGTIATTFTFNDRAFDGELKEYAPTGYVSEQDNSVWGMQFIWPFKAEYIIAYLSADYQQTIIARSARDYVWIMARTPVTDELIYQDLIQRCIDMGYDPTLIQKIPHNSSNVKIDGGKQP